MNIALIDPFFDESHKYWANGLQKYSAHQIKIYADNPNYWKWQMIGGTMDIARRIGSQVEQFDLLLVTDMLDLPCFKGYLSQYKIPPTIIYFHENQITYPWSPDDRDIPKERDHHYGFMNFRSALVAEKVIFNSNFHKNSLLDAIPPFLTQFPKNSFPNSAKRLIEKTEVIPIGFDPRDFGKANPKNDAKPTFLWNHRWEYDKGPNSFFKTLFTLKDGGLDFDLIVLGKSHRKKPEIFDEAKEYLSKEIIHWGYANSKTEYYELLVKANILLVTGVQDFFGISVVEAIAAGCYPVLPKRLAYPEHIPETTHNEVLCDEENLVPKLCEIIEMKKYLKTEPFIDFIKKYRWNHVIALYDSVFEKLVR